MGVEIDVSPKDIKDGGGTYGGVLLKTPLLPSPCGKVMGGSHAHASCNCGARVLSEVTGDEKQRGEVELFRV